MVQQTTPPGLLLYGVAAMADHVGLRRRQAQHLIDKGVMPSFRIGRTICGNKATLTAWLAAQEARTAHKSRAQNAA